MFLELVIATFMISATVVLHALALDFIIRNVQRVEMAIIYKIHHLWKPFVLAAIVLCVFAAHVVEIWLWAFLYICLYALPNFETALYFSTTAFTTVGFGDVLPAQNWRLLGSIEAANGIMLFGWSTAFTFEIVSQLYRPEGRSIKAKNLS